VRAEDSVPTAKQVAEALKVYNYWRRGDEGDMPCPVAVGALIDQAVGLLKTRLQWIPSSERLPLPSDRADLSDHLPCLCVYTKYGPEICILHWNFPFSVWDDSEGDDFFCDPIDVSHWMPLPQLPSMPGDQQGGAK